MFGNNALEQASIYWEDINDQCLENCSNGIQQLKDDLGCFFRAAYDDADEFNFRSAAGVCGLDTPEACPFPFKVDAPETENGSAKVTVVAQVLTTAVFLAMALLM